MTATIAPDQPRATEGAHQGVGHLVDLRPVDRLDGSRRRAHASCNPRTMMRNPVMFIVEVGSVLTTLLFVRDLGEQLGAGEPVRRPRRGMAVVHRAVRQLRRGDGRRSRQGAGRRAALDPGRHHGPGSRWPTARSTEKSSSLLELGDLCVVTAGEVIPGDGEIVEGIATVDESAITGESAPVIRESGGDRSAVTGGTRVLSDEIVVRITARPGETFLDRMIALVEGADRQKTPNEIALSILLVRADDRVPARGHHAAAVRHLLRRRAERHRARSLCSCASSRPRSVDCCRRSASPAWTGWCSATCWPCRAGRSRPPAT